MNKTVMGLAGLAFAFCSATAGKAHAFVQERYGSFAESYGNSNVYGAFSIDGGMQNANGSIGVITPNSFASMPYLTSNAQQDIDTSIKIFGLSAKPFTAMLSAEAYWQLGDGDVDIYKPRTHAAVTLLGSTLYSTSGVNCGTGMRCISSTKSYEKEFARQTAVFVLWGVPVSVSGAISGSVSAEMNADSTATALNGEHATLAGAANATWGPSAALTASFDTCLGLCGFIAVGVTASFRVLEVSFTPRSQAIQNTRLAGTAKYSWINRASLDLSTMNGEAAVFADFLGARQKKTFVSWNGYSDAWYLWGFTGSTSCSNYLTRPSSDCRSYATN